MTDGKLDPVAGKPVTDRIKQTAATVGASVEAATDTAATAVRAGAARAAGDLAAARTIAVEKGSAFVRSGASGIAAGFGVASETLTGFAENLDWSTIDPTRYLYAGTRGVSRSLEEARLVWKSIPEELRALGPEELTKRLDGFDWSHIVPHSKGGGNEAANGIFEFAGLNRSRGAEQMTGRDRGGGQGSFGGGVRRCARESGVTRIRRRRGWRRRSLRGLGSGIRSRVSARRDHPGGNVSAPGPCGGRIRGRRCSNIRRYGRCRFGLPRSHTPCGAPDDAAGGPGLVRRWRQGPPARERVVPVVSRGFWYPAP